MTDLADFLLARIAEDEDAARAEDVFITEFVAPQRTGTAWAPSPFESAGIGPARVLAECDAKRRIVEVHRMSYADAADETWARNGRCDECGAAVPCQTLRLLALPFADHPDYRDEWRP